MSTQEIKTMYLARRSATMARADFPRRWRRHGQLAMGLPFWRNASGYLHGDVRADPPRDADGETGGSWTGEYDGVGSVYFLSSRALERLYTHPDFSRLLMDEWGAFAEPVQNFSVLAREEIIKEQPGTSVKFFAFLHALPGVDAAEFDERWRAHASLIMRSDELVDLTCKYIHNHAISVEEAGEADERVRDRIQTGMDGVAGISELGFASETELEVYLRHPGRAGVRKDLAGFVDLDRMVLVATNEVTMCNRHRAVA